MTASINHINDARKTVKNGTEYWMILNGTLLNSAIPCLLWMNLYQSCKVKLRIKMECNNADLQEEACVVY
jgi:hypothetical protein